MIASLALLLNQDRAWMSATDIAEVERTIRVHRISILKQRARMGALGHEV